MDFYREQFSSSVDTNALEQLKKEYQGSEEEARDVLAAFEKHKGNMDRVYDSIMLCNVLDDDDRFRTIINKAIADGEVENYKKYAEESDAKRQQRVKAAQKRQEGAQQGKPNGTNGKDSGKIKGYGSTTNSGRTSPSPSAAPNNTGGEDAHEQDNLLPWYESNDFCRA